jgi:hypothetical protein
MIGQDDSPANVDRRQVHRLVHRAGHTERLEYRHRRAHEDPPAALPDITAWCWARSGRWRRRIAPILTAVRPVQ